MFLFHYDGALMKLASILGCKKSLKLKIYAIKAINFLKMLKFPLPVTYYTKT